MILHTINKPAALSDCSSQIEGDDLVVLIEDGVYLADHRFEGSCFIVEADARARGMAVDELDDIELIDYQRFVQLCVSADKVCAWF